MWPLGFGLACCAIEMMSTFAPHFDLARYGMEVMRPSPRQADLMIVSGRVSMKMAPVIKTLYEQMPNPKWVIAMGAPEQLMDGILKLYEKVDKESLKDKREDWGRRVG
jgi:NADH-quinone oxidoreductase subunit B